MALQGSPISMRKLDLLYMAFFLIHIPIMLMVDLVPIYPAVLAPKFSTNLRAWYINKYRDQFFISPPNWFYVYVALEAVYHLPLSIWAVGALLRDDAMVPLHLLVWSIETAVTTLTCVVEAMSWQGYSRKEQSALLQLYLPYLLLALWMGVDMFFRLRTQLMGKLGLTSTKSQEPYLANPATISTFPERHAGNGSLVVSPTKTVSHSIGRRTRQR